jgi:hypothetical protein
VHALSFTRPWHWRQPSARDLALDVLKSAADPAVVRAAIQPLYRAGDEAIIAGAKALIDVTRTDADEETADSLGRLMGGAALFLPNVPDELRSWLDALPPTGDPTDRRSPKGVSEWRRLHNEGERPSR